MAKIGYVRISTEQQNTARQETILADCDKVFIDKASGKNDKRPQLEEMLSYIREGDIVKVESYSRIARNTRDLLKLVDIFNNKGVAFVSVKENVDTSTPQGRLMLTIFAGLAEFEREQILQRQAEGIREAKKAGKYKGRKPIQTDKIQFAKAVKRWKSGEQTAVETMKQLNMKRSTFYRRIKEYEQEQ